MGSTLDVQSKGGGSIPASSLHFLGGQRAEAEALVLGYHYSKRTPANVQFIGSLHLPGGLFGDQGECVAAAFFSIPPTRWSEPVLELTRLVRKDKTVPLSLLIRLSLKALKRKGADLVVSFADETQGHKGYVYRACNWAYDGCRERRKDGVIVDGTFCPGRTCNNLWGTQSPDKLREMFPCKTIEPHYDEGKHLYWRALGRRGAAKAQRLSLKSIPYT